MTNIERIQNKISLKQEFCIESGLDYWPEVIREFVKHNSDTIPGQYNPETSWRIIAEEINFKTAKKEIKNLKLAGSSSTGERAWKTYTKMRTNKRFEVKIEGGILKTISKKQFNICKKYMMLLLEL